METISAIVGWGAIANKLEASQETCVFFVVFFWGGGKITQVSLQIIKWYIPYIMNSLKG